MLCFRTSFIHCCSLIEDIFTRGMHACDTCKSSKEWMSTGRRTRTAEQRVTQVAGSLQHMGTQPARGARDQYVSHQEPGCLGLEAGMSLMKSTSQESKPLRAPKLVVVSLTSPVAFCREALCTYTQSWLEELHLHIMGARKDQAAGKHSRGCRVDSHAL